MKNYLEWMDIWTSPELPGTVRSFVSEETMNRLWNLVTKNTHVSRSMPSLPSRGIVCLIWITSWRKIPITTTICRMEVFRRLTTRFMIPPANQSHIQMDVFTQWTPPASRVFILDGVMQMKSQCFLLLIRIERIPVDDSISKDLILLFPEGMYEIFSIMWMPMSCSVGISDRRRSGRLTVWFYYICSGRRKCHFSDLNGTSVITIRDVGS